MGEVVKILILAVLFYVLIECLNLREQKKMNGHQVSILNSSIDIDIENIIGTFEMFVEIVMKQYLDLNITFKDINYINTELEEELFRDISTEVMSQMSPYLISKLSLVYKIHNEDDLATVVTRTVYLKLLDYIGNINSIKDK